MKALPGGGLRHGISRELLDDRACAETIDAAFAVHAALGSWHQAETYKNALVVEMGARNLRVHRDATLSVLYRQRPVGAFPADLLVEERVLVIVKADPSLTSDHRTETVRGVVAGGVRVGLVFNFGVSELFFARIV
jgi:GxxExxY protein